MRFGARHILLALAALVCAVCGAREARAQGTTLYESAEYVAPTSWTGWNCNANYWWGVFFSTPAEHQITGIGAHLKGGTFDSSIFIAIFETDGNMPLAPSPDASDAYFLTAVIPPKGTSGDFMFPVDFTLPSGNWAVVFGSGAGGATGSSNLASFNNEIGSPRYLTANGGAWSVQYDLGMRFVIQAEASCGDGVVDPGENCDDGGESASCDSDCTAVTCGDGKANTTAGELCDDGAESAACNADCTFAECGDGKVNHAAGETCDDANADEEDGCLSTCISVQCGDGIAQPGVEACDDGELNSDTEPDACRTDCVPAHCGDGVTDNEEACDDGNSSNQDFCLNTCELPVCGDGVINGDEECDDGPQNSDQAIDACRTDCLLHYCGDGVLDSDELCDDGNRSNQDGCTTACTLASCGNGVVDLGEDCDDGNASNLDACLNVCRNASCGDGFAGPGEECDDANRRNDDGCSNACVLNSPPRQLSPTPSSGGCQVSPGRRTSACGLPAVLMMLVFTRARRLLAFWGR